MARALAGALVRCLPESLGLPLRELCTETLDVETPTLPP